MKTVPSYKNAHEYESMEIDRIVFWRWFGFRNYVIVYTQIKPESYIAVICNNSVSWASKKSFSEKQETFHFILLQFRAIVNVAMSSKSVEKVENNDAH